MSTLYTTNTNECRFNPVQCTWEKFETLRAQEGYVYFVTDKKKLFLGKNNQMIPMCASSGIFYGRKPIEYDNSGNKPDPKVTFVFSLDESVSEIEGPDKPELDDLILNVGTAEFEDGCFYRVVNVAEDSIETTRLTLQGTGGGGGGSSSGGSSANFSITVVGTTSKAYSSTATTMPITFKGYYNGTEENRIAQVKFTKRGDTEPFYIYTEKELPFNENNTLDLFPYKALFGSTRTTVTVAVQDLYGNERSTNFTVQIVELSLKASKDELLYSMETSYLYECTLAGATSGVSNKQITYTFYDEDNLTTPRLTIVEDLDVSHEGSTQKLLNLSTLSHGVYVLKVLASAVIGSSNTTLYSNELTHKIGRFDTSSTGNPLLLIKVPDVTEQYTNIPVHYLLVTTESNKEYHLSISLDGVEKTELAISSNNANSYPLYFEEKGTYTLLCSIVELALSYSQYLNIVAYTGNLPIIDPTRGDLMLYLNPRGKSNDATDRDEWKDYNGLYTASLKNLHYGQVNGWMMDAEGTSYLKLSSGASLELPDFKPFVYDPTKVSSADSRMGYGMTIEIDFEISGVLDFDEDIIKCYSTDLAETTIPVGFRVLGDKVQFFNSRLNNGFDSDGNPLGALMSLNLVEGKRTRVSFVLEPNTGKIDFPMCYAYLDGKLSAAKIYESNDSFKDSNNPAYLNISAENAEVKIYGIRFYSSALADKMILNNFTASLPTLEEKQKRFDSNNVFNANNKIDYNLVAAEDYDLGIPYMKITGGWATEKESKWQLKGQANANAGLPTGKKDYRLIDVEVKYPKYTKAEIDAGQAYFLDYKDYKFVNKFASGKPMATAYGEKPSNGGVIMYAQGTSSMEYPVKNLRLRFKNESDYYRVRPDIEKVEIICMKADYMESSGSHNTGAANFVDALYTGVNIETPGQEHFGGEGKDTIVTCIKGHPCLIFYSASGEPGTYEYIGKYNLNLDKATPEPFGFKQDGDFGSLKEGNKYYFVEYDEEGEYVGNETEKTVAAGEKINSIHCFEFLDNAVDVCNFLPKEGYTYRDTWYNTFTNSDNDSVPGWTLGFESRYPEDKVGYHDADALYPLASWLAELKVKYDEELAAGKKPTDITYEYEYTLATGYQDYVGYYYQDGDGNWQLENNISKDTFPNPNSKYYTRAVKSSTFSMVSLERFKREYECYLDKDFLLTYYLVTEALLMADSRVKNMMIATWGREKRSYVDYESGATIYPDPYGDGSGTYIFYPIFYDMDTMLGLDNTGKYRFNYYDEDTNASVFNGQEVLWNFVRDALPSELKTWYSNLEGASLKADAILPYFNNNQANMANEAFYNGDAQYKYVIPAREGYQDHLNDKYIEPGVGPFLYALQGDRSLMREWFITNRIKFLKGKYNSNSYQNGDRVEFRWYYPTGKEDEFTVNGVDHGSSITAVPPSGKFEFTSLKTGYAGVKLGANGNTYNERFDGEETKEIDLNEAKNANGTEAYLLGISNLTDLGDLSNKYMQKFIISSDDCRLKTLTLGSPKKDYFNPYLTDSKIGITSCTYLEEFNLQNCSSYKEVMDFSKCPAIRKVLLTGSSTTGISLPVNGVLDELRLPTTTTQIKIVSHPNLRDDWVDEDGNPHGFSLGTYDYGTASEIGKGNGYVNDFSKITELYVVDTPINTYPMVIQSDKTLTSYYLQGINWTITEANEMYCKLDKKDFEAGKSYYEYVNGSYVLVAMESWPADDNIYKKVSMMDGNNIVAIPVLDYLATKTILAGNNTGEALTGTITINVSGSADELALYQKYNAMYPNITFKYGNKVTVTNAIRVSFYRVDTETLGDNSISGIEPYFTTLTAPGTKTISELIGNNLAAPTKPSTSTKVYSFTGRWHDWTDKTVYYQDGYYSETTAPDANRLFSKFKPQNNDMLLVPEFRESTRIYNVNFYDWNYTFGADPLFSFECQFEDWLKDHSGDDARLYYVYRPADEEILSTNENNRYSFKGWQNESDFNNNVKNPELIDIEKTQVRSDLNFFAYYEVEDATLVPSPEILFNCKADKVTVAGKEFGNIYTLTLKDVYRSIIGGKITLPSTYNGTPVLAVAKFNSVPELTDIYVLETAQYKYINDNAFNYNRKLESVHLPATMTMIGGSAFYEDNALEHFYWNDSPVTRIGDSAFAETEVLRMSALPTTLEYVGIRAFLNAGPNVTISTLPDKLNKIPTQCFMGCSNITISTFPARDSACSIGYSAFQNGGTGVTTIRIEAPWTLETEGQTNARPFFNGYKSVTTVQVYADFAADYIVDGVLDTEAISKALFEEIRTNCTFQQIGAE